MKKNFLGRGLYPTPFGEGDTPSPVSTPLGAYGASTLRLDAFGVSRPPYWKILDPPLLRWATDRSRALIDLPSTTVD